MRNIFYYFATFIILSLTNCTSDGLSLVATDTGIAGSYARFLVIGDNLYTVDRTSIKTFDLTNPEQPTLRDQQEIGSNIETIFHHRGQLFIGSSNGMFIYTLAENGLPQRISESVYNNEEFLSFGCNLIDPIVANDKYAYVTLSTSRGVNECNAVSIINTNVLKIYDIENISAPQLLIEYPMIHPKGVGLDGETLFVCDDIAGLKIFNVQDPFAITLIAHFDTFTAFDVIPLNGLLLVVGPDNIYQFDYSDLDNIFQLGTIPIES